jgi:sarcosine oxidase
MRSESDVAIVGLGAMGSAAAWRLAERGAAVVGFDRFDPPHDRGSSHGESRIIRSAYYESPLYVPLVRSAFALWRELEAVSGEQILTMTGALSIGPETSEQVAGALESAQAHGLAHELIDRRRMESRFPQHRLAAGEVALYEAEAGFLRPERAIAAALARARGLGAELYRDTAIDEISGEGKGVVIRAGGRSWRARHAVVAAGAWHVKGLLPDLAVPIEVTRQLMGWFPADRGLFTPVSFPVFVRHLGRPPFTFAYGFPIVEASTVKVGLAREGDPADPDGLDRDVHPEDLEPLVEFVRTHLAGVEPRAIKAQVCMQENSPDRHFLVGPLPGGRQITVLAGFSGHGFKFAPVIGEIAADLALDGATPHPIEHLSLERHLEGAC